MLIHYALYINPPLIVLINSDDDVYSQKNLAPAAMKQLMVQKLAHRYDPKKLYDYVTMSTIIEIVIFM